MQSENYRRFDFDFDKFYRGIIRRQKNGFLHVGSYYNLSIKDFCHDVLIRTINYFDKNEPNKPISRVAFENIFWTTARFQKLSSIKGRKKTQEFKTFVQMSSLEPVGDEIPRVEYQKMEVKTASEQPSIDDKFLVELVSNNYPTATKIMEGYYMKELGKEYGVSGAAISKRFSKEIKDIKQKYGEFIN